MNNNLKNIFNDAVRLHQAGNIKQAAGLYQKVLAINPSHPDALHLLGVTATQLKQPEAAVTLISSAIAKNPEAAHYYTNLGVALQQLNRIEEAISQFYEALRLKPDNHFAHYNLGNIFQSQKDFEQAVKYYQTALSLNPRYVEARNNLGLVFQELHRFEDAVLQFHEVLKLLPGDAGAHFNLGNIFRMKEDHEQALNHYQSAISLNPSYMEAHNNLGSLLRHRGKLLEACRHFLIAMHLSPETEDAINNFAQTSRYLIFSSDDQSIREALISCLNRRGIDHQDLAQASVSILNCSHDFTSLIAQLESPSPDVRAVLFHNPDLLRFVSDPLLLSLLKKTLILDREFEHLLTGIRRQCLLLAVRDTMNIPDAEPWNSFLCSLATHCFLNEYVYSMTDFEKQALDKLKGETLDRIDKSCDSFSRYVILLGCFIPLGMLDRNDELLALTSNLSSPELDELITNHIREPETERKFLTALSSVGVADNTVSKTVQSQYEENPYPRWTSLYKTTPRPAKEVITKLFPALSESNLSLSNAPDILIAGCGTGRHAIYTTTRFDQSTVVAIDISRTSLAYAARKAHELDVSNISFIQSDILNLTPDKGNFDIIECVGVLHHMEDPVHGWKILKNLLKPGGFMKIGLYSQLARLHIAAARTFIEENNFLSTPDGIRACRQAIFDLPVNSPLKKLTTCGDFYSLSTTRDLIFHVQEHLFTIPEISTIIENLELEFLGFELDDKRVLQEDNDGILCDPATMSLEDWHELELEYPDTFINMYRFWVRNK